MNEKDAAIDELEEKLKKSQMEIEAKSQLAKKLDAKNLQLSTANLKNLRDKSIMSNEKKVLSDLLTTAKDKIAQLTNTIKDHESAEKELSKARRELEEVITSKDTELVEKEKIIIKLKNKLETKNQTILNQNSQITQLSKANQELKMNKQSVSKEIIAKNAKIENLKLKRLSESNQEEQEAFVVQRVTELQNEGLWTANSSEVLEPARPKSQWNYLLEEMKWMATEFAKDC